MLTLAQASMMTGCPKQACFYGSLGELRLESTMRTFSSERSYWRGESQLDQRIHDQVARSWGEGGVFYV